MEKEQEMKSLGVFGVYKESFKIICSWRNWKIFSLITLTLLLPLSFIFLIHMEVTNLLSTEILRTTREMNHSRQGSPWYEHLSHHLSSEWTTFWLVKLFYFTFLLIFSVLSTSTVVSTVSSIYSATDVTVYKVMSIVPKVWKRLMLTLLWTFTSFFTYNVMAILVVVIIWTVTIGREMGGVMVFVGIILLAILYVGGDMYLTVIWELASVVSVFEERCGVEAMMKSMELIKGKTRVAMLIFLNLEVSFVIILVLFMAGVHGWSLGPLNTAAYGVMCLLMLSVLSLFWLVVKTVLYFVCKSYHHENDIDNSASSDPIKLYLGEYEPSMKPKDVPANQYHV